MNDNTQQPEQTDDVEGHAYTSGRGVASNRAGTASRGSLSGREVPTDAETEGHSYRWPATESAETEGHGALSKHAVPTDGDDTEGHAVKWSRVVDGEDADTEGHAGSRNF